MRKYLGNAGLQALWADIDQMVHSELEGTFDYQGEVATHSALPALGSDDGGLAYRVMERFGPYDAGTVYMWDGSAWLPLGGSSSFTDTSDGTQAGPIHTLQAEGWAEQDGTPSPDSPQEIRVARGRNLLPNNVGSQTVRGVTFTVNADGSVTAKGTATANAQLNLKSRLTDGFTLPTGTYVLSGCPNGGSSSKYELAVNHTEDDSSVVDAHDYGDGSSFTVDNDGLPFGVYIMILNGVTVDLTFYPQLELGSTPSPYVPYGYVGLEAQGKNLLDLGVTPILNAATVSIRDDVVTMTANASGVAHADFKVTVEVGEHYTLSGQFANATGLMVLNASRTMAITTVTVDGGSASFIATEPTCYIRLYKDDASSGNVSVATIQFEHGSTATAYEPYHHSTTPIPLPSRGWVGSLPDGTADTLTIDGAGKVTWEKATDEVVLDGSELWAMGTGVNVTRAGSNHIRSLIKYPTNNNITSSAMSTRFIAVDANHSTSAYGLFAVSSSGALLFNHSASINDVSTWKNWLRSNPVTVLYPLATPVTENMGYVDLPEIPEGATLSILELDNLGVEYFVDGSVAALAMEWYARARSEYADRIAALEQAVAELATS